MIGFSTKYLVQSEIDFMSAHTSLSGFTVLIAFISHLWFRFRAV